MKHYDKRLLHQINFVDYFFASLKSTFLNLNLCVKNFRLRLFPKFVIPRNEKSQHYFLEILQYASLLSE
ncbi:hypothetical protein ACFP3I_10085 [Chryseobacterium arachidis]|uniref:hypothetical protein n=1 Tax=Chryseobacterium arachidis TaxID=1416778 RepID=UPI003606DC30